MAQDRRVFDTLREQLNIQRAEDWYQLTADQVRGVEGGKALLKRWNYSAALAVLHTLPPPSSSAQWLPWLFTQLPRARFSWQSAQHQREYCEWLFHTQLHHRASEASWQLWYTAHISLLLTHHGATLAYRYQLNLHKLLQAVYPEHPWDGWRFQPLPKHYWKYLIASPDAPLLDAQRERQRAAEALRFVEHLEALFAIQHVTDWHRISQAQMQKCVPGFPVQRWAAYLRALLAHKYPSYPLAQLFDTT